jgi:hypothetical protein
MTPLLPPDIWRAELGLHPWFFWGLTHPQLMSIDSKCSPLTFEYGWQGSDTAGRDDIRRAIERAEEMLLSYLGFRVAPQYTEQTVDWPRYGVTGQTRYLDSDATGRRIAVMLPEGHVQAVGIEQLTLIGTATVAGGELVFSDEFSTGFEDTFTITLPTSVTNPDQIAVYFASADRLDGAAVGDRWRIEPVRVSISGGNVTIIGRKWLLVKPIRYETPRPQGLDPTLTTTFVTGLEVYQRTTNEAGNSTTTSQALLIYETNDCGTCWGRWCCGGDPPASSDPATTGVVIARAGIRDSTLGLVTPGAAVYDSSSGTWSSAWHCGGMCDPDRVTVRYLAGWPLQNGQMDRKWQSVVTKLAAAEMKRRICACRESNERLHDLQQDMALQSTQTERYQISQRDYDNPFGLRRGHIQAWKDAQDHILRRGMLA